MSKLLYVSRLCVYSTCTISILVCTLSFSHIYSQDGYLYDREAILECLLHQKRESTYAYVRSNIRRCILICMYVCIVSM